MARPQSGSYQELSHFNLSHPYQQEDAILFESSIESSAYYWRLMIIQNEQLERFITEQLSCTKTRQSCWGLHLPVWVLCDC